MSAALKLRDEPTNAVNGSPFTRHNAFETQFSGVEHQFLYSSDGDRLAQMEGNGVSVYDAETGDYLFHCHGPEGTILQAVDLSPKGKYLVTYSKQMGKGSDGGNSLTWTHCTKSHTFPLSSSVDGNLVVWDVASGGLVAHFSSKGVFVSEAWPFIQWSSDESLACRIAPDGIHLHEEKSLRQGLTKPDHTVALERLSGMKLAPNMRQGSGGAPACSVWIAAFVTEANKERVDFFEYPHRLGSPVMSLPLPAAEEASLLWAHDSYAMLVLSSVLVDATNQNYYGANSLSLITMPSPGEPARLGPVLLDRDGPVHDVAWSPVSHEFVVVYGTMPAKAALFTPEGIPAFSYGSGAFNTVIWAPHGRFLVLGGFGNLAGQMQFWDKSMQQKLGQANAHCAIYRAFSPCSRFFMTAVTFPGLRVDNQFSLWTYDGKLVYTESGIPELYQCEWRPSPPGCWADRTSSPDVLAVAKAADKTAALAGVGSKGAGFKPFRRVSFGLHNEEEAAPVGAVHHTLARAPANLPRPSGGLRVFSQGLYSLPNGPPGAALSKTQKRKLKKKEKEMNRSAPPSAGQAGGDSGADSDAQGTSG